MGMEKKGEQEENEEKDRGGRKSGEMDPFSDIY